ncbi:MAG: Membrane protein [Candidatus Ozemobacter sibiricus]|uniref:Membrane protein n=1 Tax=Candidatus Ozemobacter sibiricus TaxID=2268124 RepID=A0A367Z7E4_9BACT|nr:MAG: Membrane protein [Candidatus Ozemobacter sibiricus]
MKLLPETGPMVITGWRSVFTLLWLVGLFGWVAGGPGAAWARFRQRLGVRAIWGSAIAYALMLVFFIAATRLTTAANAIFLQYTAPFYVALLSWPMLGEPLHRRDWLPLMGCLAGMALFFGERLSTDGLVGNILGIVSGVACGVNAIFLRLLSRHPALGADEGDASTARPASAEDHAPPSPDEPPNGLLQALPAIVLGNALTILICLPWMATWSPSGQVMMVLAGMGLFQLGIPYTLFMLGLAHITALEAMVLGMVEAVLNPIWTAIGAGERPSLPAIAGGVLILGSVLTFTAGRATSPDAPNRQSRPPQADPAPREKTLPA